MKRPALLRRSATAHVCWAICGAVCLGSPALSFEAKTTLTGSASTKCEAEIRITNGDLSDMTTGFTDDVDANGIAVRVHIEIGAGIVPDTYEIEPPEGYMAFPAFLELPEGEAATVLICGGVA